MNLTYNKVSHTPYDWITNYSGVPNSVSTMNYDGNCMPRLQTTTVDTIVSSFTHQLHLNETFPVSSTFTPSMAQFFESYFSNSSLQWMANYRAINHYYNLRKVNTPLPQRPVYVNHSSLLSSNPLLQIKYLVPQSNHTPAQESSTNVFENSIRNVQRLQQKMSTLYPPWKHFNMRRAVTPNVEQVSKLNLPVMDSNLQPNDFKLNNSAKPNLHFAQNPQNSNSDTKFNSENPKNQKANSSIENSNFPSKLCSCNIKSSCKNNYLVEYLYKYYNYINPYCEVCAISSRRKSNLMQMNDQKLLLHFLKLNSHELTDGIKTILSWPLEKVASNFSVTDGLTSFYEDENKKKIEELFSDKNEQSVEKTQADNLQIIYQPQPLLKNLTTINYEQFERSNGVILEDMIKYHEAHYNFLKSKINRIQNEEQVRNRMAEFVCIGPLNNSWYMELLNGFWIRDRPRMSYTRNFLKTDSFDGDLIKAQRL